MPQKCETQPVGGWASRDSCAGPSLDSHNLPRRQAQFLIAAYHVRPEHAATIAALAFGSAHHG